jgi:hypothetical protein
VVVTVLCLTAGWVAYQLNWIRQRHAFLNQYQGDIIVKADGTAPFPLRLLGESGIHTLRALIDKQCRNRLLEKANPHLERSDAMGIGSQSLKGQDKADFLDIMDTAKGTKRTGLEKKMAKITKEAITAAGAVTAAKVRSEIAQRIKNRILK